MRNRLQLAAIGGLGGSAFWLLLDYLPNRLDDPRVLLLLASFAAAFFIPLLLLNGRLPIRAALAFSLAVAVAASAVFFWASFRHVRVEGFLETGHPIFALTLLIWLPLPFILAHRTAPAGWRDYEGLFDHAWSNFVRMVTAFSFTGLFWIVVLLSDQLLQLVGFGLLGDLIEKLWFAMPLTGIVLGLALAVLDEMKVIVSTLRSLALQLLRLLLPPVAVVVGLFIVLVPFRGLEQVFGSLSAAGTMLAIAMGAVTLISASVDGRDADAAGSRLMVLCGKALSLLLPVITGIAIYAIWARVAQYGWTPARLAATLLALVAFGYALAYAGSVLMGAGWCARIRTANRSMAIVAMGLALVWLTPVLNAERLSANSHIARFNAGRLGVTDLDLWSLKEDWGQAGTAALQRLRKLAEQPGETELAMRFTQFDQAENRWADRAGSSDPVSEDALAQLIAKLPVRPISAEVPPDLYAEIPWGMRAPILAACRTNGTGGCVLVVGKFDPSRARTDGVLFWVDPKQERARIATISASHHTPGYRFRIDPVALGGDFEAESGKQLISAILNGEFAFAPARLNALEINGVQILPPR